MTHQLSPEEQHPDTAEITPPQADPSETAANNKSGAPEAMLRAGTDKFVTTADGQLDIWATLGGWRAIVDSLVPGLVFLLVYIFTWDHFPAVTAALAVSILSGLISLATKQKNFSQLFAGLLGIGLCYVVTLSTGRAKDFYVPGFYSNAGMILLMGVSLAIGKPLVGVVFGAIRHEGIPWYQEHARAQNAAGETAESTAPWWQRPERKRRYTLATLLLLLVPILRLCVQVPLYFQDAVEALGVSRLLMGLPLNAALLWVGWLMTRPVVPASDVAELPPAQK